MRRRALIASSGVIAPADAAGALSPLGAAVVAHESASALPKENQSSLIIYRALRLRIREHERAGR